MYKVVASTGFTTKDMYTGLTEEEATEVCESYGWQDASDGGLVWDLSIVEEVSE